MGCCVSLTCIVFVDGLLCEFNVYSVCWWVVV